jgi:uncharacterized membrane-anchored protein YhcB (DUF1043 family)
MLAPTRAAWVATAVFVLAGLVTGYFVMRTQPPDVAEASFRTGAPY